MLDVNRRFFMTGLLATPAIVSINSIMPVKAIERFSEIQNYDTWLLAKSGDTSFWATRSLLNQIHKDYNIIREVKTPIMTSLYGREATKFTVDLMKIHPSRVVYELPSTW